MHEGDADAAAFTLEEGQQIRHLDPTQPAFEQLVLGETGAPIVHRDDDLLDSSAKRKTHQASARTIERALRDFAAIAGPFGISPPSPGALI